MDEDFLSDARVHLASPLLLPQHDTRFERTNRELKVTVQVGADSVGSGR